MPRLEGADEAEEEQKEEREEDDEEEEEEEDEEEDEDEEDADEEEEEAEEETETGFRVVVIGLTIEDGFTDFTSEAVDLLVRSKAEGSSLMESTGASSSNKVRRGVFAGVSESEDEEAVETSIS